VARRHLRLTKQETTERVGDARYVRGVEGQAGYRWLAILRDVVLDRPELITAVQANNGRAIVALLEGYLAEAEEDLRDFQRSHRKMVEGKMRRLGRLEAVWHEEDTDDLEWDAWEALREQLDRARDDPEVEWFFDEVGNRRAAIRSWRHRIRDSKDIAGIELLPKRGRYRDDDESETG
jgi:hypothetical protein